MARRTVVDLLAEVLARDARDLDMDLEEDFALTPENRVEPVDIAKLAIACERTYRLALRDEEVAQWRTLGDAMAHVARLLEEGQAEPTERSEEDRTAWFYE